MMASRDRRDVCRATMVAVVCSVFVWLAPAAAHAQVSRLGGMITVAQGAIRYSDVGYDPANNVYLVVSGAGRLFARFVAADGAVLGNVALIPDVSVGTYAPRVTYSADRGGFLVTWLDFRGSPKENTHIRGRFVKYDTTGGQVVLDSADFFIAAGTGGAGAETAPATAYSTASKEFLVAWKQYQGGLQNVYAQRVGLDGSLLGGELPLTFDVHFQDDPAVGYDPINNSFLVAWQNYTEPRGPGGVQARRVDAGSGTVYPTVQIFTGMDGYTPDVTYHPGSGKFFVTYFSNRVHYGVFTDASGNAAGAGPVPVVSGSGWYNAWSVAFNPVSNSFFSAFHGTSPEDFGVEINTSGVPGTIITATATGVREGNYNPRVAARTKAAEWMLAVQTSDGKPTSLLTAQVITSATRNPGGGVVEPPAPTPPVTDATQIDQVNAPNGSEYFAEGNATSDGTFNFNTYYQLLNTNESLDASVRAYFAKQTDNGTVVLKETTVTVPKNGRTTVDLKALVGNGAWSAVFQSQTVGAPIEAQQSVFWGPNFEGSSSESSARATSATWLFAEGTRGANDFFATFFQLFNPSLSPIDVIGEYFTDGSATPVTRTYMLPPSGRFTVFANGIAELAGKDFSTRFRALDGQSGFVAQRAMYWGANYAGGHSSIGVNQSQPTWMFAEGAAFTNFDTYYLVLNPNPFDVSVDVVYFTATGFVSRPGGALNVKANSRMNVHLNSELGSIGAVAAKFSTLGGYGIVVERSIYWGRGFPNWIEGTNDLGVNAPATEWEVPEGSDAALFDTYLLVANPNSIDVSVRVQFFLEGGGRITPPAPLTVKAFSRATIDMSNPGGMLALDAADIALLKAKPFSARVASLTPGGPVIVEQAVYRDFQPGVFWRAGASAFGIPRP